MHKRLLTTLIMLAALGTAAPPASAGSFSVSCPFAKFEQIDPIFSFGQPSHHLHAFKGNKTVTSTSTYASLRATPADGTTCSRLTDTDKPGSGDLSSYWFPTLIRHELDGTETRFTVVNMATYYQSKHHDRSQIQPFPPGLKMLAGDPDATAPQPRSRAHMWCSNGGVLVRYDNGGLQCLDDDPLDGATSRLRMDVRFPSCWNGEAPSDADAQPGQTSYDDSSKMAYAVAVNGNDASPWTCPATHPIPVPEILFLVGWQTAGGPDVHLSNHNEFGEHADFFEAWDPAVFQKLVENCVRTTLHCGQRDGT